MTDLKPAPEGFRRNRKVRVRRSLRLRLLAVYLPVLTLAVIGVFSALEIRNLRGDMAVLHQHVQDVVNQSATLLAEPLWQYDEVLIGNVVDVLSRDEYLDSIRIEDAAGTRFIDQLPNVIVNVPEQLMASRAIFYTTPDDIQVIGQLTMVFTEAPVRAAFFERMAVNLMVLVAVIVVTILVTLVATGRLIDAPLRALMQSIDRVRIEGVREPVTWESNDELGEVVGAYNAMLEAQVKAEAIQDKLIDLGITLSAEQDQEDLLSMVVDAAMEITGADGCTLYLVEGDNLIFSVSRNITLGIRIGGSEATQTAKAFQPLALYDDEGTPLMRSLAARVYHTGEVVNVENVMLETRFALDDVADFNAQTGYQTRSILSVPMAIRGERTMGILQMVNALDWETGEAVSFDAGQIRFLEALASQAAVAIENAELIAAQKELMEAIIELMASAIDSKSPYTGGHCARVPEAARMLAEEACTQEDGAFGTFEMSEEDWECFRIASWLHDCGKVTTPEYVVDKATKLETINNRLHEIRTRFEVLRRDAEIAYWKGIVFGADKERLERERDRTFQDLDEEYRFVAKANIGGEFMDDADITRLREIGARTWYRYFDDTLGLSVDELKQKQKNPWQPLPAAENLLDDKPEHVIERAPGLAERPFGENPLGFRMEVPKSLYNHGELHNLTIRRGTLTEEERFKINDHIIQTIVMLSALPWPKYLENVPEMAGGHHEKMDGTGYPKGLRASDMSLQARIMAIADIFEALTAADRPYKKAKPLSEAIQIMTAMCRDQHIDPDLFRLFLTSGCYRRYAERFLLPEQLDEVDIEGALNAA
ncbi:MAG: HD domain-containing phosphohydrolase [Magnetovibrionaceae bacterium]